MIQRFRQYLIDSYNGLYKIVLEPSMPTKQTIILLLVGLLIGIVWGYVLAPVQYYDGTPNQLNQTDRDQWIKLVSASYYAGMYDDATVTALLQRVEDPAGSIARLLSAAPSGSVEQAALESIQPLAPAQGTAAPRPAGLLSQVISFLIPFILIIILTPILVLVWRLLIYGNIVAPLWNKIRRKSPEELEREKQFAIEKAARQQAIAMQKDIVKAVDEQLGAPVMQKLAIYTKGRQFDESFAIEDQSEMFLGECGAAIAKTIGETKELAAIEIWLFDKEDFVRTLTKIFVSEYAYNDPAIRSELEPKVENPATDIVMVVEGAKLVLETDALRLQATVKSVTYGTGPLPPNSYFDSINIEIAVWQKVGATKAIPVPVGVPAPATMGAMPTAPAYDAPIAPPPAAPTYTPPPPTFSPSSPPLSPPPMTRPVAPPTANPGIRPLSPPPLGGTPARQPLPPEDDDDPFGGTGDFTPLGS
jgi:hypothetical protein